MGCKETDAPSARSVFKISLERLEQLRSEMKELCDMEDGQQLKRDTVDKLLDIKERFGDNKNELSFMMFYTGYGSGMSNMLKIVHLVVEKLFGSMEAYLVGQACYPAIELQLLGISGLEPECTCPSCRDGADDQPVEDQPYHQ